jgi:hypothetical protein
MSEQISPGNFASDWAESETSGSEVEIAQLPRVINDSGPQRIYLPRGSAESRFAPRQYYYLASDSGVVPRWALETRASMMSAH